MGARDPVSLNEASARMLKRELANLRRQFTNLQRNLTHKALRRHEVVGGLSTQAMVQVWYSGATLGDLKEATSHVHSARTIRWKGGSSITSSSDVTGRDCWLLLVDHFDTDTGDVIAEHGRHYGPASRTGSMVVAGERRPLYVATIGHQQYLAKADSSITKGSSGTFSLYHRSEVDSTINKTAKALLGAVATSKWCHVTRINGQWYGMQGEC